MATDLTGQFSLGEQVDRQFQAHDETHSNKGQERVNVEVLKSIYAAIQTMVEQRNSEAGVAELCELFQSTHHPDVEYHWPGPDRIPFSGVLRGREAVLSRIIENFRMVTPQQTRIVSVVAQGDEAIVTLEENGLFHAPDGTDVRYSGIFSQYHKFSDGQVVLMRFLGDNESVFND